MGFLFQILFIGSISVITFLAIYTLLIFLFNFINKKKDSTQNLNESRNKVVIFSHTANEAANIF
jgi:hypothetical protein